MRFQILFKDKKMMNRLKRQIIVLALLVFPFTFSIAQSNGFEVIKNLELIDLIYLNLEKYYVDEPRTGAISKAGIDAMLAELDPYTVFYHEANIEDYRMMTTGQYGGIGALIRKIDDYVVIAEPYENNPAEQAGLMAGDIILFIDGKDMKGKSTEEVSTALKGTKGTSFVLKYDRPFVGVGEVEVTRDEIKMPDVPYSGLMADGIGYIKLNSFTQTASKSVTEAFETLKAEGMEKLILDLRGNGGGLLAESVNIVNMFVPKGQKVVETKARIVEENRTYKTQNAPLDIEIPIVVLIDETSASASEIVSGSLQDLDRGVVVGNTSFGKGLVQRTLDLKYGSKMKLTIARYYTPSGRCVQKLDYYHKYDGRVDEVPDSLITVFQTKNGREVIDGRGIEPDIKTESEELAKITAVLLLENIVFDFATKFSRENPSISAPKEFKLEDNQWNELRSYILEKDFKYATRSEEKLAELFDIARAEGYDELIEKEYQALMQKLRASKEKDVDLFKDQIIALAENEIVSRYYFQNGRIMHAFRDDKALEEAIAILSDLNRYNAILKP